MEKGTILIVDDNKGVLASLELLLETEFSEIKTAGNPNQIISIYNPQIEMFARFKTKSSFHKTKRII